MSEVTRYPLCWPAGKRRAASRRASSFETTLGQARDGLLHELKLLGGEKVVISSNLRLRQDGLPYADQREPDDPGVAVYFAYKGREVCFACDRWDRIKDNLQAIRHTINALRGISRWGTGDMVEAAFSGFAQLPAARVAIRPWWEVIGVQSYASTETVEAAYRLKAKELHPDRGGDHDAMIELNDAYERFKRERGL